jgi:hypothetical protein
MSTLPRGTFLVFVRGVFGRESGIGSRAKVERLLLAEPAARRRVLARNGRFIAWDRDGRSDQRTAW